MSKMTSNQKGFTIVELLIVIVIIGILAALVIVAYNGITSRANAARIEADINAVQNLVENYQAENGFYPTTGGALGSTNVARTDANCATGSKQSDWVPGLTTALPQSTPNTNKGVNGNTTGCYMYTSDGTSYMISAWDMLDTPQNSIMYRRIGFREIGNVQYYYCNQVNIGGNNPTPYLATRDYYKYSYTVSNVKTCNETPPAGA